MSQRGSYVLTLHVHGVDDNEAHRLAEAAAQAMNRNLDYEGRVMSAGVQQVVLLSRESRTER